MPQRAVDTLILLALADAPRHGYALVRRVEELSDGQVRLLPGNLYARLRRLTLEGTVCESAAAPRPGDDARRRYYQLTPAGRRALQREARRLERLLRLVRRHPRLRREAEQA